MWPETTLSERGANSTVSVDKSALSRPVEKQLSTYRLSVAPGSLTESSPIGKMSQTARYAAYIRASIDAQETTRQHDAIDEWHTEHAPGLISVATNSPSSLR